jgi:hypothetical protein
MRHLNKEAMPIVLACFLVLSSAFSAKAQNPYSGSKPHLIKLSLFSESIGIPNFSRFLKQSGLGLRVGTELYYGNNSNCQYFQTINLGFYSHKGFASAFFISTEAGYRRYFGSFFSDATLGGGIQFSHSYLPVYKRTENGYVQSKGNLVRIMPILGLGAGYQFNKAAVFTRYELSGDMPFGYKGIIALPHQNIHIGTQVSF